jgi:endoglucanase
MWEQIAPVFRDYDHRLIFEVLNEPREKNSTAEWNGGTQEERLNLNILNQLAVDTIRATGGNNLHRILMVPTYAASPRVMAFQDFVMPSDPLSGSVNKLALSIHAYEPNGFCFVRGTADFSESHRLAVTNALERVASNAAAMNVPVIMGEWGSVNKENTSERAAHAEHYVRECTRLGIVTVWWDNGSDAVGTTGGSDGFGLIRRGAPHSTTWDRAGNVQPIIDAIMRGAPNVGRLNVGSGGGTTTTVSQGTVTNSPGNPTTTSSANAVTTVSTTITTPGNNPTTIGTTTGTPTNTTASVTMTTTTGGGGTPNTTTTANTTTNTTTTANTTTNTTTTSGNNNVTTTTVTTTTADTTTSAVVTTVTTTPPTTTSATTTTTSGGNNNQPGSGLTFNLASDGRATRIADGNILRLELSASDAAAFAGATGGAVLTVTYTSDGNNSSRRISAWTNLSGSSVESLAFASEANHEAGSVIRNPERITAGATTAAVTIPHRLLHSNGNSATVIYLILTTDNVNTSDVTNNRGAAEFSRFASIALELREAPGPGEPPGESGDFAALTAHQLVARMGAGWNLGNQFDAYSSGSTSYSNPINGSGWNWLAGGVYSAMSVSQMETAWVGGSANAVSRDLLNSVKTAGFDTIRIPVTWHKAIVGTHTSSSFTIREDWMARIKRVVDWSLEAGFVVILNIHHDEYILPFRDSATTTQAVTTVTRLWTLIGDEFKDYGENLVFEVLNEPRIKGHGQEWQGGIRSHRQNLNRLNQASVDAIRATGGNNRYRILMIPTYAASSAPSWANNEGGAFDSFEMPNDTGNSVNKFILSIHAYDPGNFTGINGVNGSWSASDITTVFNRIYTTANRLNVPVVLGEWGAVARHDDHSNSAERTRADYARTYTTEATRRGFVTVWWDTGLGGAVMTQEGRWGLFERSTGRVHYPNIVTAIMDGIRAGRS